MILHLHLVRHGQTTFNRYNRLQGWCNAPLTEAGLADADKAAEKLKYVRFAAAYCSDTSRAQITAKRILDVNEEVGNARPVLVSDMHFREQCYGYFEGQDMSRRLDGRGRAPRREGLQRHRRQVRPRRDPRLPQGGRPVPRRGIRRRILGPRARGVFPDRVQPGSQGRRRRAADIPWQYAAQPHAPLRAGRV